MESANTQWLLLIVSLPTNSATARMRIWRALKGLGYGALRDGAYLLPDEPAHQQAMQELAGDTVREGGSAWLLTVQAQSESENDSYRVLFDRSSDYTELLKTLAQARNALTGMGISEINRLLRKLRRDYDAIRMIDYFPSDFSALADAAWMDFVHVAETMLSPGEPQAMEAAIKRLDSRDYQGRLWATRSRPWVDRVASAWLIQRFIDHKARLLWLATPADCPPDALGFDFDGASFSHIGDRVTFEVLLASFNLDQDRALLKIGAMVHTLDVGGAPVAEACGFEAVLAGARRRIADDDQLLTEIALVLDSLYEHFSNHPEGRTA